MLMRGHDCGCPCRVPSTIVSYRATVFTLFDGTIARCPGTNTQFSSTSPSTASCVAEHGWLGNQVIGDEFSDERGFESPSSVPGGISMDHFLRSLIQPSTRRRWRCGGLKSLVNPGEVCTDTRPQELTRLVVQR